MRLAKACLFVLLLLPLGSLISEPVAYAEEVKDTLWIEILRDTIQVDSLPVGTSFKMSIYVSNPDPDTLRAIDMHFGFNDPDMARLDSFSYSDPTCRLNDFSILDIRSETPATYSIEFLFNSSQNENYLHPGRGKIVDLWFFGISEGTFSIDEIDSCMFHHFDAAKVRPRFLTDNVVLSPYADPGSTDFFWIKENVDFDTVGINAKFPLPFTAYNDEILSGFEIPLLIVGNNAPTFYRTAFKNTDLEDTLISDSVYTLAADSTLIRLELKKGLQDTVLEPGDQNKLFDLWLQANDSPGRCSIYTDFVPHIGNLFFIDSVGGFTPTSYEIACTTFSYKEGDINRNNVVNNVDLFYLAMYLFLPKDTSSGESSYDPEDLNKIKYQRLFQSTEISSEEWDSTFSEILFRGDVNADSRVDVGDFYIISKHFQGDEPIDLEYGWSNPQSIPLCNHDTVKINFQKTYPDQKIPILIEIYNQHSLAGMTLPLQIPDTTKIHCDSITRVGRFRDFTFDWEWMTWDENYDQADTNQDLLIAVSTIGTIQFPHIPQSLSDRADSAFILWCTIKAPLDTSDYIECVSLLPSHEISFFDTTSGYSCTPHLTKFIVQTVFADYGDAPDGTNPHFAGWSFPTLYDTTENGRRGPHHKDINETDMLGSSITREWNAKIKDLDADNLSDTLYIHEGSIAWYIAPVMVTANSGAIRYLNVLYDVNGDKKWEKDQYKEWVIQNKVIMPAYTDITERIILGPFDIEQKPDSVPTWARFTLTRDSIPAQMFGDSGWDGSGPEDGWDDGETEDILFDISKTLTDLLFSVSLEDSAYDIPAGSTIVRVGVNLMGGSGIQGLALDWQVFDSTDGGNAITFDYKQCYPGQCGAPTSFNLSSNDSSITFIYYASFQGNPNGRTSRVLWKVTYDSQDGTTLVATDEAEFKESAEPYFEFLDTWDDPISCYGGVVDLRLLVKDPDQDYPVEVTFKRGRFEKGIFGDKTVDHAPVFGILGDSTKIFDNKALTADQVDILYAYTPDDTLLIFHWAADTSDTVVNTRVAILKVEDSTQASIETNLTININDALPLVNKIWVGRTGVIGIKDIPFKVPVEVYNKDTLNDIYLPLQIIGGNIDSLLGWSFDSTTRLYNDSVLTYREDTLPKPLPVHTDTVTTKLSRVSQQYGLSPGFGKIFYLWFTGNDTTCFQFVPLREIEFTPWDGPSIEPVFESYEIRVIEEIGEWICGDANADGKVDASDIVFLINCLFKEKECPDPPARGDATCDGVPPDYFPTISDVVYLANYIWKGGPPPMQCYGCIPP